MHAEMAGATVVTTCAALPIFRRRRMDLHAESMLNFTRGRTTESATAKQDEHRER